ncbi:HPr family phosphocarrier protein [Paenibacillus protaetiae]|uniref:HPr family phosphocarrier protein n=2 Tax=Paenibacillus protaetiae TaxID=2509456 RepID=A0A4P6F569_9BACL|nr:HPr family phosphocarrier protein [Paenibacillus protaetiae]
MVNHTLEREDLMAISQKAARFTADIILKFQFSDVEHSVDVKSLLGIMLLPIHQGVTVRLETKGKDELEALEFVLPLLEKR